MLGVGPWSTYRFLRYARDGRIAYAIRRPNGVTELKFMRRR